MQPQALEVWPFNYPKISKKKYKVAISKKQPSVKRAVRSHSVSSFLPQRMLRGNVKTFDVIFKKMGEESIRAVELELEGHSLFIYNFKP